MADSKPEFNYESAAPNAYEWTEAAHDALLAGTLGASVCVAGGIETARVSGKCPRCDHEVHFSHVRDAVAGHSAGTLGASNVPATELYVSIDAECRCSEGHPGRPKEIGHGCGINFRIDVIAE